MPARLRVLVVFAVAALALVSCGSTSTTGSATTGGSAGGGGTGTTAPIGPACPVAPLPIVVTVDQWGDIVRQVVGRCGDVTTIVTGTSGDPHDYEPTPGDLAAFGRAQLVVMNGAGYDAWATKAVDALAARPSVIDVAEKAGWHEGDNPHLWYQPSVVDRVSGDIARSLAWKDPLALEYLAQRSIDWRHAREPYDAAIRAVKQKAAGKRYVATESVFDLLAADVGLTNVTPAGYRNASANESEPSPGDVNDVQKLLRDEQVDVLVFNAQTSGAIPEQLRRAAEDGGVPVVDVTESIPPGQPGFVAWQVDQLERLAKALG